MSHVGIGNTFLTKDLTNCSVSTRQFSFNWLSPFDQKNGIKSNILSDFLNCQQSASAHSSVDVACSSLPGSGKPDMISSFHGSSINVKRIKWLIHQLFHQETNWIGQRNGSQGGEIYWKSDDKGHLVEKVNWFMQWFQTERMWCGEEWVMRRKLAVHLKPIITCAVDNLVCKMKFSVQRNSSLFL